MTFKTVATITSVLAFMLGVGYLFAGTILLGRWNMQVTEEVLLIARRLGALNLGLSVIFFLARSAPPSGVRTAITAGTATALSVLALLGVYEFTAGRVGAGIFASVAIESLLTAGFLLVLFKGWRETPGAAGSSSGRTGH